VKYQLHSVNAILFDYKGVERNIELDKKRFNIDINSWLFENNLITNKVTRVEIRDNIMLFNTHATMKMEDWFDYFQREFSTLEEDNTIADRLPENILQNINVLNNSVSGGIVADEIGIDLRVQGMVDYVASKKDVYTFSSCDGHNKNPFYVMWHGGNPIDIVKDLNKVLSEKYDKYFDSNNVFRMDYLMNEYNWIKFETPEKPDIYYEMRFVVNWDNPESHKFYDYIEEVLEELK